LAQNWPCQPNEAVALHGAGFMVPPPRLQNTAWPFSGPAKPQETNKVEYMAKVAFLGLGVMGYPMAAHLKNKGGHEVTVYNRTVAKAEKWVGQHGGRLEKTPKEAAEGQDFVMCCVGNDNDLREVTLGGNG